MLVVTFTSTKGGVGKSTILSNVAYLVSQRMSTIVIDLSHSDKTTTRILARPCVNTRPGAVEYLYGISGDNSLEFCGKGEGAHVDLIPPGEVVVKREVSYYEVARRLIRLVNYLLGRYSIIFIDTPARTLEDTPLLQAAMAVTDVAVLVTEPTAASVAALHDHWRTITQHVEPPPLLAIILNKAIKSSGELRGLVKGGFYAEVPLSADVMALAQTEGAPYVHYVRDRQWLSAIQRIAEQILGLAVRVKHAERRVI